MKENTDIKLSMYVDAPISLVERVNCQRHLQIIGC
jgi:hypothetical protein